MHITFTINILKTFILKGMSTFQEARTRQSVHIQILRQKLVTQQRYINIK